MSSISMISKQTWEITFGLEENTEETQSCYLLFIAQQQDNKIWEKNVQRKISASVDFIPIIGLNNACFSCAQYYLFVCAAVVLFAQDVQMSVAVLRTHSPHLTTFPGQAISTFTLKKQTVPCLLSLLMHLLLR